MSEFLVIEDDYLDDLKKELLEAIAETQKDVQKKVATRALELFHEGTPKKTGNAAFNWQSSIENPIVSARVGSDLDGITVKSELAETLAQLGDWQEIHIVNNCHYIELLENGSSLQAPEGFFALGIETLKSEFDELVEIPDEMD